ncbi:unnamed protein product [Brachionus calyciflorus]|uniref:Uncharacterized protein n=1 Tax=Brachionus calyciflorus TaxID=104777 RepID=A0A813YUH8_9BILA|nr:unnamed protein product [Brachionus calyciflorus]
MGCGASKDPKVAVADSHKPLPNPNNRNYQNNKNGFKQVELKNNTQNSYKQQANKKAPLAFEIMFDETNNNTAKRPPPGRLRLEPLKHNPTTKAEIDDKIRSAEIKRERILADRAKSTSGKKVGQKRNFSDNRLDSDSFSRNDSDLRYNGRPDSSERNSESKQRLLNRRRIIQNPDYDDDIEHDRNYNLENDDFDRRY